jgi:hypothetical protein
VAGGAPALQSRAVRINGGAKRLPQSNVAGEPPALQSWVEGAWMAFRVLLMVVANLIAASSASASDYVARRAAALAQCEKINPSDYQTGLLFNPDGYRSYYARSECLQRAAIQFRDDSLCEQVRRRWALLSSSWGVAPAQCHKLVAEGVNKDRAELVQVKQFYSAGPVKLQSFRVERNGNGRDFDFIPSFSSGYSSGYHLNFELLPQGKAPVLLHSDGYYLDADPNLRIYVRQADIRQRFAEFELNHRYTVRATLFLSLGMGGEGGYWSDEFVESVFPLRERSQSMTIETEF